MAARPSRCRPELLDTMTDRMAKGELLAVICRDPAMPTARTLLAWAQADEAVAAAIAQARTLGFEAIAAQCLEIVDDAAGDHVRKKRANGEEVESFVAEHVQRSKLRVETRLKLLAKWDPKKYGERIDLTSGGDKLEPMDETERLARIMSILQKARAEEAGEDCDGVEVSGADAGGAGAGEALR